jgi:DNA-binding MarR family transcriptional regulator
MKSRHACAGANTPEYRVWLNRGGGTIAASLSTKSVCTITEALVLIAIYFEDQQQASPSKLGAALRTSRSNVSHCLAHLQQQKWIRRSIADHDARCLLVSITPSGSKLAQKLILEIEKIEKYCESHLSGADQSKLLKMLFGLDCDLPTKAHRPAPAAGTSVDPWLI